MAYKAGYALPSVVWPDDATDDQKRVGVHHCPFAEGDPQRTHWLKGLRDSLEEPDPRERANLVKRLDDELKGADGAH